MSHWSNLARAAILAAFTITPAIAQTAPPSPNTPPAPTTSENITVQGDRFRQLAPTPNIHPGPDGTRLNGDALIPEPSVRPRSHCNTALQNDIGGQPGTSQTTTLNCN